MTADLFRSRKNDALAGEICVWYHERNDERGGRMMDIERTKQFYRELKQSDVCDCAYCRNYVKEVKKAYPAVTAYL